jgi:hypothetical protein
MWTSENLDSWSGGGWGRLLSVGAPDTFWCATGRCLVCQPRHPTVRVLEQLTVGGLSSSGTRQSGAASERHCSLSGAPLATALTFPRTVALQASVAVDCCAG